MKDKSLVDGLLITNQTLTLQAVGNSFSSGCQSNENRYVLQEEQMLC